MTLTPDLEFGGKKWQLLSFGCVTGASLNVAAWPGRALGLWVPPSVGRITQVGQF